MIPYTGTILRPSSTYQHDAVLLDVVALAGEVGGNDTPRRQLDAHRLALARVGLLGPRDAHLEADAPERRGLDRRVRGRYGVSRSSGLAAALRPSVSKRTGPARRLPREDRTRGETGREGAVPEEPDSELRRRRGSPRRLCWERDGRAGAQLAGARLVSVLRASPDAVITVLTASFWRSGGVWRRWM